MSLVVSTISPKLKRILLVREFDLHRALGVLDEAQHFVHRLARQDDAGHSGRAGRRRQLDPREAMAVGGHGAQHLMALDLDRMQEDAVEIIARLLAGDGELRLLDQLLEVGGRQREAMR